jgi:hypothetical protein
MTVSAASTAYYEATTLKSLSKPFEPKGEGYILPHKIIENSKQSFELWPYTDLVKVMAFFDSGGRGELILEGNHQSVIFEMDSASITENAVNQIAVLRPRKLEVFTQKSRKSPTAVTRGEAAAAAAESTVEKLEDHAAIREKERAREAKDWQSGGTTEDAVDKAQFAEASMLASQPDPKSLAAAERGVAPKVSKSRDIRITSDAKSADKTGDWEIHLDEEPSITAPERRRSAAAQTPQSRKRGQRDDDVIVPTAEATTAPIAPSMRASPMKPASTSASTTQRVAPPKNSFEFDDNDIDAVASTRATKTRATSASRHAAQAPPGKTGDGSSAKNPVVVPAGASTLASILGAGGVRRDLGTSMEGVPLKASQSGPSVLAGLKPATEMKPAKAAVAADVDADFEFEPGMEEDFKDKEKRESARAASSSKPAPPPRAASAGKGKAAAVPAVKGKTGKSAKKGAVPEPPHVVPRAKRGTGIPLGTSQDIASAAVRVRPPTRSTPEPSQELVTPLPKTTYEKASSVATSLTPPPAKRQAVAQPGPDGSDVPSVAASEAHESAFVVPAAVDTSYDVMSDGDELEKEPPTRAQPTAQTVARPRFATLAPPSSVALSRREAEEAQGSDSDDDAPHAARAAPSEYMDDGGGGAGALDENDIKRATQTLTKTLNRHLQLAEESMHHAKKVRLRAFSSVMEKRAAELGGGENLSAEVSSATAAVESLAARLLKKLESMAARADSSYAKQIEIYTQLYNANEDLSAYSVAAHSKLKAITAEAAKAVREAEAKAKASTKAAKQMAARAAEERAAAKKREDAGKLDAVFANFYSY